MYCWSKRPLLRSSLSDLESGDDPRSILKFELKWLSWSKRTRTMLRCRDEHWSFWPNRYFGTGTGEERGMSSVFRYRYRYRYRRVSVPVLVLIPISVKVLTIGITVKIPGNSTFTETFTCIGNQFQGGEPVLILVTSKKIQIKSW